MPSSKTSRNSRSTPMPVVLIGAGLLLMVVAAVLLFSNTPGSSAVVQPTIPPALANASATATAVASVVRIQPTEADTARQSAAAVILDVRSVEEFAQSHISGAINIPYNEIASRIGELDPNQPVIAYCT